MDYIDSIENIEKENSREQLDEDVRKIQFTGKSTYVISLPKKWVTGQGLKAGSKLSVVQKGNILILTPKGIGKPQVQTHFATLNISSTDKSDGVVRKIIALYLAGYKTVSIRTREESIDTSLRTAIKDLTRKKLVGTEIISETEKEIKIQVLVSYPDLSVENAMRRMALIADFMHEKAILALKNLDKKLGVEIIDLDDEVDRFSLYVIRQLKVAIRNEQVLQEIGLSSPQDCLGYRVIVKFVERIADHAALIAKSLQEISIKLSEKDYLRIVELSNGARNAFENAIKSLFTKDCALAEEVISNGRKIIELEESAIKSIQLKQKLVDLQNIRIILESIRRCAEYACDIAEIVINLNIERELAKNSK